MKTVVLVTITFGIIEKYDLASENEPSKEQIFSLIGKIAKEANKAGLVSYKKYIPIENGRRKIYLFEVGGEPVTAEVRRLNIVKFEK